MHLKLLQKDNFVTIHQANFQVLTIEIFKKIKGSINQNYERSLGINTAFL